MAKTAFATDSPEAVKLWSERMYRDTLKEAYFARFMGTTENSIVQRDTQMKKSAGDRVRFAIAMRLQGSGVKSGQTLEGKEERLVTHNFDVILEQYRHAVRDAGALDRQRVMFSIDQVSLERLKGWGAEKIDQLLFNAALENNSKAFFGAGSATSTAALTAADKITPELLSKVKTWAITGGDRKQTPFRPVRVDGRNYFVCVVHPDVAFDLIMDPVFQQARREAEVRGRENPLFTGAYMIWDGIVVHAHENIPIFTNWGATGTVPGASCLFMGAQALVWAEGGREGARPQIITEQFDYKNERGYGWEILARAGKPRFNNKDYAVAAVNVARTQISDAA